MKIVTALFGFAFVGLMTGCSGTSDDVSSDNDDGASSDALVASMAFDDNGAIAGVTIDPDSTDPSRGYGNIDLATGTARFVNNGSVSHRVILVGSPLYVLQGNGKWDVNVVREKVVAPGKSFNVSVGNNIYQDLFVYATIARSPMPLVDYSLHTRDQDRVNPSRRHGGSGGSPRCGNVCTSTIDGVRTCRDVPCAPPPSLPGFG